MSRYHPKRNIEPTLNAAVNWKTKALVQKTSIFSAAAVWSDENLDALNEHFVENPDNGDGSFMSKLQGQLVSVPVGAKQLAAEMLWFMLLCPSNTGPESKRETVLSIWDWSGADHPPNEPWLTDDVLQGIGSAGAAFNTLRWRELVFFIKLVRAFRLLTSSDQLRLLDDGWAFAEWLEEIPGSDRRQLRHMILYLLFPDEFENIFGGSDLRRLVVAMTDYTKPQLKRMSAVQVSQEIRKIRRSLEDKFQRTEFSFYEPELKKLWVAEARSESLDTAVPEASSFQIATESILREHVVHALTEIDRDSYPTDARSSTYDLIQADRRYPPKYVLSLAAKHANGAVLPRQDFSGGIDSSAFKKLNALGFHIELKNFVTELLKDFIAQANEASDLTVKNYPKQYRGLKIKVSFGQGNFAKVPWISFTGFEQTTSKGIYPVVLYYKSTSTLIVAYGVSETNSPDVSWQRPGESQTTASYFEANLRSQPERYGASYVGGVFDLSELEDLGEIEASLDRVVGQFHQQFDGETIDAAVEQPLATYEVSEALNGLFIEEEIFNEILSLLRQKKNLILQGPPGVGKTFVCKRLAYALMEEKAEHRLGMVQFHQSYAYEDFVQGYRPSGTGFRLKNGIFHEFCEKAKKDPSGTYVFIIDEINRGNLSKIFGELMMLIEADKRGPEWQIPLTYSEDTEDKFYIPENLYLIGLMNTADRSLAMVDYALRRRFAFADLKPGFDTEEFRDFMEDKGANSAFVEELIEKIEILNKKIAEDTTNLGPGYCVGHSYFCSIADGQIPDWQWYQRVIKTEVGPLLYEYYFDDEKQANSLIEALLKES